MGALCFFRDGRLRVGDELINVNGRRLRGLEIEDAIRALRTSNASSATSDLDMVVSRGGGGGWTDGGTAAHAPRDYENLSPGDALSDVGVGAVSRRDILSRPNFVTRTYIGGGSTSSSSSAVAAKLNSR